MYLDNYWFTDSADVGLPHIITMLCGCVTDIGGVRALQLIQKHGDLEAVMAQLDTARYGIPDPFPYQEARILFKGTLWTSPAARPLAITI